MKQLIRNNTFETNSSSMHSIVIANNNEYFTDEEIIDSFYNRYDVTTKTVDFTKVEYYDGESAVFGRAPFQVLSSFCDKLEYAIASYGATDTQVNELLNTVKSNIKCLNDVTFKFSEEDITNPVLKFYYGVIDHQSVDVLQDFCNQGISIIEFLTNKKYVVFIDGDEYDVTGKLKASKLLYNEENISTLTGIIDTDLEDLKEAHLNNSAILTLKEIPDKTQNKYTDLKLDTDDTIEFYSTYYHSQDTDLLIGSFEKAHYLLNIYGIENSSKLSEFATALFAHYKDLKKIKFGDYLFDEVQYNAEMARLVDNFLKDANISLSDFIFDDHYVIVLNNYKWFDDLLTHNLININQIDDIVDLNCYDITSVEISRDDLLINF